MEGELLHLLNIREESQAETPWHCHEQGQLFLIHQGIMATEAGQGRWWMLPGRLAWIPPGLAHKGTNLGPVRGIQFLLESSLCTSLPELPRVYACAGFLAAAFARLGEALEAPFAPQRQARLLGVLLDELVNAQPEPLYLPLFRDPRLVRMAQALLMDPADRRGLDTWATFCGMSRRTLCRQVQAETGLTFGQWRTQMRLLAALKRLAEGEDVTRVAFSAGFESVSAFIARFRAHFGVTPGRYFPAHPQKQG